MTDEQYERLADRVVAAVREGDQNVLGDILGVWDGTTGAPAWWARHLARMVEEVALLAVTPTEADWVVIENAMNGEFPIKALNMPARRSVIDRLAAKGLADQEIANRIGLDRRSVTRIRSDAGIPCGLGRRAAAV